MYNRVILAGRLTRTPELQQTKTGKDVTNFSIAVDRIGDPDAVDFFDAEAWNKTAVNLAAYKTKGDPILLEGRLKYQRWEQDGQPRSKVSVVADNIKFLPKGGAAVVTEEETAEAPF